MSDDKISTKDYIEIWKNVIEVEKHFNNICITLRNIFATLIVGLVAAIGFSLKEEWTFSFLSKEVSVGVALCAAGVCVCFLFYFVDRYWYHRLLVATVIEAQRIELEISNIGPYELKMTKGISDRSPVAFRWWIALPFKVYVWEKRFIKDNLLHSDGKIELFYKSTVLIFIGLGIVAYLT